NQTYAEARAISEDGKVAVVCKSTGTSVDGLAAIWDSGTLTGIGMPAGRPIVVPNGVNVAGVVAGTTNLTTLSMPLQYNRAFITQNGTAAELLPGTAGDNSTAIAINDAGQVLGTH